jgi:sortase A
MTGDTAVRHRSSARARRGWRMPWMAFVTALVFFVGTVVLLLPTIANWFSQLEQAHAISDLSGEVHDFGAESLAEALAVARAYNATLTGGAIVAANERIPVSEADIATASSLDYNQVLAADARGLMARIKIPVIGVDLPVFHGTDDETLTDGVGHLEGTALPVGGIGTRSVLTAHRGLANSELFTNLDKVQIGDTFTIEVFGEVLTYRVSEIEVVAPEDSTALYPDAERDLVTLVTCTPLGINSHRILVTGERLLPTPVADLQNAGNRPQIPGFPWWMIIVGVAFAGPAAYVWHAGRAPRPKAPADQPSSD